MNGTSKVNSIRLCLMVAAGLAGAAVSSQAQNATATISWVATGSSYNYTITVKNTGSIALNSFWYGWTTGGNNLPSVPTNPGNSSGWSNTVSGNSIMWVNGSYTSYGYTYYYGTSLAPGASATFTFASTSPPSAVTASPSGESVAYVGSIDSSQDAPGDSTAVFSPVPQTSTVPTVAATITGVAAGSSFDYTITLTNTGTAALNSFWYGWTTGGNNLASAPTLAGNSLGWSNDLSGNSIMWINSSGTALAPGAWATFTFVSASSPSAITTAPSGQSVAYEGAIDFSQDKAGDSTAVFSPALVTAPAPVPTVAATITGVAAGSSFDYTITLTNTGTAALNGFWYGWTTGGNNLPSAPTLAGNSLGWSNDLSGNSIIWVNSSGTALAPGAWATFTFVSTSSPSAITTAPSGQSVAYVGAIDFSQNKAGDSTAAFSPTLVTPAAPALAVSFHPTGSGTLAPNSIILAWPTKNAGFTLQSTTNLVAPVWATVPLVPVVVNGQYTVTNIISGPRQFFRLATP